MSVSTFGITYTDIESALDGYSLSADSSAVSAIVTRVAAEWNALLKREGITPADVSATDTLYSISQRYIILKSSAEVGRRWTHLDPELSRQREASADSLAKLLHEAPEAVYDAWDPNEQRGSWRTNQRIEERTPGSISTTRTPRNRWGVKF